MGTLDGRVAFVTGAARGQGRSHAVALAREGAAVVAVDICRAVEHVAYPAATPDDLAETVRSVERVGGRCLAQVADTRRIEELEQAYAAGTDALGAIDIVVANAGIFTMSTIAEMEPDLWRQMIDVNLTGAFNTLRVALPSLQRQRRGRVVVIASTAARGAFHGTGHYTAAKWGLIGLTKASAVESAPFGVTVNALCPTNCDTVMFKNARTYSFFRPDLEDPTWEDVEELASQQHPMGVPCVEPEDISAAVLYLVSDGARYVTGDVLTVSAGMMASNVA